MLYLGLHDERELAEFTLLDVRTLDPPLQTVLAKFVFIVKIMSKFKITTSENPQEKKGKILKFAKPYSYQLTA